jgi:hypothetical protein
MNRSVLIVTPFFAPQNHSAVFRAYKLAKYLPKFGWMPVVLTVDTQYEFTEDVTLLADLPDEVEVVSARYIEPTFRGIRMALGGRDRTFQATRSRTAIGGDSANGDGPSTFQQAYRSLLTNWCHTPDAYWTWASTATDIGKKILKERDIQCVITSAPPFSSLLVGQALHNAGARWIADFRDPLAYTKRLSSDSSHIYRQQRDIVKSALTNADAVTVAASCFRSIYFDMFGRQGADPMFIPTGMDKQLLEPVANHPAQHWPYLLFAGEYLPDYDTAFLEAFAGALKHPRVRQSGITLLVVGTLELNQTRLMPLIDKFELHEHVEFLDQQPQRDVYGLLSRSLAGILIPGPRAYWWTTFAKMTDCIGMRKPVVAVVPDPSEARTALTRSRLGVFLDGPVERRTEILTDFLLGEHKLPHPDERECDRYTADRQVQSFANLLECLAAAPESATR